MRKINLSLIIASWLRKYVFFCSMIMIFQLIIYLPYYISRFNVLNWLAEKMPTTKSVLMMALGSLFLFSVINILFCGALSIAMLTEKEYRKHGLLGVISVFSFYLCLKHLAEGF